MVIGSSLTYKKHAKRNLIDQITLKTSTALENSSINIGLMISKNKTKQNQTKPNKIPPLGFPVLPDVYMMIAGEAGVGGMGSASTSTRLLFVVFLPSDTTSQKEIRRTSSLEI